MTALQTHPRVLSGSDSAAIDALIARDPVLNCVLQSRVQAVPSLDRRRLGGQFWGVDDDNGGLRAAIYHGGNLIPLGQDLAALAAIAGALAYNPRGCSSIVGEVEAVDTIWPALSRRWGRARMIRGRQPFMVCDEASTVAGDRTVRRVRLTELDQFMPAAIAMFTEELHASPIGHDGGASYRNRVADLIAGGRAFARFDQHGAVEFKAEIGALGSATAQIQGVWVRPDLRGSGLGTAAMAQVLVLALELAPTVSLYVNEFNTVARKLYERLGMRQTHTLSTVLF